MLMVQRVVADTRQSADGRTSNRWRAIIDSMVNHQAPGLKGEPGRGGGLPRKPTRPGSCCPRKPVPWATKPITALREVPSGRRA
jgi:hypothetical protein